ncbi:RecQ family ATP-dependent DNA helicase [Aquisalibacillus elongatus]|uniref:ATP-dependent DNA helicase RecQ n=1 Tax=Aquisalibacillus elongatus TaxID=485577 RepID=A0A3N5BDI4_9BACI|nr:ATP-dependent DNA helicase RecQ [Aquisalibacillus elongatus]RPF55744.1 ATP-dependent DNA helicase RecQ [Aquisalibacillus elongatus]
MNETVFELEKQLQEKFGFPAFREGQKEIIESVMNGNHTLATLPTGSGKSICYQLPSILLDGVTVVVSPLISLMIDQVKILKSQGFKRVAALNSLLDKEQKNKTLSKLEHYDLIYCSPEMLQQPVVINRLKQIKISLFVIDEAHCISQWGHEFRTDYLRLKDVIKSLEEPTVLALSATATPKIQQDIIHDLSISLNKIIYPMDRTNITYQVQYSENHSEKQEQLVNIINQVHAPTMVYFSSRLLTEEVSSLLKKKFPNRQIAFYHGGMEQQDRLLIQQQFMHGQLDIICCTSAFGMGVNKDDVRLVIHYHLPSNLESFIQESGRAGRDGNHSVSVLLYTHGDENIPFQMIDSELPNDIEIKQYIDHGKLEDEEYSEIKLRFLDYQLNHASETEFNLIDTIKQVRDQRKKVKIKSLMDLLGWIKSDSCRREGLFKLYQPNVRAADYDCCDYCGFEFYNIDLNQKSYVVNRTNWEGVLNDLFNGVSF